VAVPVTQELTELVFDCNNNSWYAKLEFPQDIDRLQVNGIYERLDEKMISRPGGFIRQVVSVSDTKLRVFFSGVSPRMVASLFREILADLELPPLATL
jgi:hypothetical protein